MVRRIDVVAAVLGTLLMMLLGWVPLIGAFVTGFITGAIVKSQRMGFYVSLVVGAVGGIIMYNLWHITTLPFLMLIQGGLFGPVLAALENSLIYAGPLAVYIVAFLLVVAGGALGGSFVENVCKESYVRGERTGIELERIRDGKPVGKRGPRRRTKAK